MENELIKRYTYAVTKSLSENQRADIEKELNGLIEDMLTDRLQGHEQTTRDIEAVLMELGDPARLADKYRGYQRFLISPEVFPNYWMILKLVWFALGIAMVVVFAIQSIMTPEQSPRFLLNAFGSFFMAALQGFAWVTLIFGLIEYFGVKTGKKNFPDKDEWSVADLPDLPEIEKEIKPGEPIAGIIFTVLFVVLITFGTHFFGVWIIQRGQPNTVIPFFNEEIFRSYLPYLWGVSLISILNEVLKLISGKWSLKIISFGLFSELLNSALLIMMFSNQVIWNEDFPAQMAEAGLLDTAENMTGFIHTWEYITQHLIYFIGLIFILQVVLTVVKAIRLNRTNRQGNKPVTQTR